jgi:electron transfer flavoprotein beta subunit
VKILVPLKRVPDPELKTKIKDGAIDLTGANWVVNPFDEYAVETASGSSRTARAGRVTAARSWS